MNQPTIPPPAAMLGMISGFWTAMAIHAAARIGLADAATETPQTVEALAAATNTHPPSLHRLLRALSSVGVFAEDDKGSYISTPLSDTLRSDAPGTLRYFAISELGGEHYAAWGNLLHSIRTGEIAFDHLFSMDAWKYYAEHPEEAEIFNRSMTGITGMLEAAVLGAYDFTGVRTLVDVGGGQGSLLSAILTLYPETRGILFDAPSVVAGAQGVIDRARLGERCRIVGGDFFEEVPAGGDTYLLKFIIHDWNDEKSMIILRNIHRAMDEGGRLLLIETALRPGNDPFIGKFIDLDMMVMTGGRERTEAEFAALLGASGFELQRIIPTESPASIIEARRVG